MKKIGFIDYYLDEFHADKYPAWIEQASGGQMQVKYAYAMKDKEDGVTNRDWCDSRGIELLDSIEEVVRSSDCLIVLSPDHPEFHEELSRLPLQSGKPTYIDKTFAPDRVTAVKLFELARLHGTPMYSTSALRFAEEYAAVDKDGIAAISSWGPGRFENYSIHQIEPIVHLMGCRPQRVMYTGTPAAASFVIDFGGGKQANIHHLGRGCPFALGLTYESGECAFIKQESDFFRRLYPQPGILLRIGQARGRSEGDDRRHCHH
ncbi:Gfo/Idh/MocA family oxidoreductase [Cohnella rhizosphaerae]|uniref:Gfo/Idh/MocA-like oxidoreductase N-terminal domain-containing protein n=1 Tax=Cohnella rhizosphaerae TaxID=1457232 RepID=A0A9X4QVL9_9BACL|nr:hypothetical protein [Cohnella rhizosphaerae]MDG0813491.1 hypothetical protein [Cohnella rhizosphaerae]